MADKVNSIEELEQLRATAASQGASVPNYEEWLNIMNELDEMGVETTGSYEGDKAKLKEVEIAIQEFVQEAQIEQVAQQNKIEDNQVQKLSNSDSEQTVKANVANATSSQLIADYMKIYHLLQ